MPPRRNRPFTWAYGVTTCVARRDALLPRTLASLERGGFPAPRLFADGDDDAPAWRRQFNLDVTARHPHVRTFGNWILALGELFIRAPHADRFAVFQDDFVCVRNLREYLERTPYEPRRYYNLYTFPQNAALAAEKGVARGWFESNQRGKGAVALVFDKDAVLALLTHLKMAERPLTPGRGLTNVDGGVVNALTHAGYRELCHLPSLVQHTGAQTTMKEFDRRHPPQPLADTFPGEDFDALTLLQGAPPAGPGESAYDHLPDDLRARCVSEWQAELGAIRQAIAGDERRMRGAGASERERLAAIIRDYQRRLEATERNAPPYYTAEVKALLGKMVIPA